MIVPDINLLLYAYNASATQHRKARAWWEALANSERPIGLPWVVILGFVRLVTHPAVLTQPLRPLEATARVRTWMSLPNVTLLDPGTRHLSILENMFQSSEVAGNLTTDAHLAALAIEHQAELHSNDSDFGRFPGLRWVNPLR